MGKGDSKTAKGKRFKGSAGNSRLSARRKNKLKKEKLLIKK